MAITEKRPRNTVITKKNTQKHSNHRERPRNMGNHREKEKDPEMQSKGHRNAKDLETQRKRPRNTEEKDPEPRAVSVDPVASPHCHDFTGVSLRDEVVCNGFQDLPQVLKPTVHASQTCWDPN